MTWGVPSGVWAVFSLFPAMVPVQTLAREIYKQRICQDSQFCSLIKIWALCQLLKRDVIVRTPEHLARDPPWFTANLHLGTDIEHNTKTLFAVNFFKLNFDFLTFTLFPQWITVAMSVIIQKKKKKEKKKNYCELDSPRLIWTFAVDYPARRTKFLNT